MEITIPPEKTQASQLDARLYSIPEHVEVPCLIGRRSVLVNWGATAPRPSGDRSTATRGAVENLSAKSARRLTWALSEAPEDWGVMATLTFQEIVFDGRKVLKRFQRLLQGSPLEKLQHAWVREYQERGSVHYHYLWERRGLESLGWLANGNLQAIRRKGKEVSLVRGPLESLVVNAWSKAVDDHQVEFASFQWGGIVEVLQTENGAAHYFGSYLSKMDQKVLPEGAQKSGRWWYICPKGRKRVMRPGTLRGWPFAKPFSMVFDKEKLKGYLSERTPTHRMPPKQKQLL